MFQMKLVEKIKLQMLRSVTFSENRAVRGICRKIWWSQRGRKWQYGGALHVE
jgi:hypothetical protein